MRNADEASVACLELAKEGERFCREGNFTEAIPKFLKAISLGTNSLPTLSAIYCQLGNAYFSTNDMDNAYAYHAYDAVVARLMNDRLGEAKAYGNMGNVMKQKQKFNDALHITKKQLSIATELDDKPCLSRSYYNLGTIHHARAKLDVKKSKEESHPPREENRYIENEDLRTAMEYYMKSLKLAQSLNDHVNVGRLFGCIGNILYLLRDYRGAIDCHEKRLMIACQFGDHTAKYRAFINLGNAHVLLSEITKGIECYTSALNLATEKGDRGREAQCCFYIGSASSLLRQYSSAANYHIRHLSLARSMGDSAGQARGFTSLATVYSNLEQYPKAAYFLACNRALAEQICDEIMLKHSEEALLKLFMENKSEFVVDNGLVQFDSAADPDPITHYCRIIEDPQPRVEFCDQRSSGFSSNTFPLTPTICVQNPSVRSVGVEARASRQCNDQQEDFFEFLSRMQSARLDEQRCDVTALKVNPLCLGRRQTDCFTTTSEGPDALIELLLNAQSRRMDEQRAALLPGFNDEAQANQLLEKLESSSGENRGSKDEDNLIELLMRAQSQRMNEQRSELAPDPKNATESDPPSSTPEDEVSSLVMRMQAGRFEDQRAHLQSQNEND